MAEPDGRARWIAARQREFALGARFVLSSPWAGFYQHDVGTEPVVSLDPNGSKDVATYKNPTRGIAAGVALSVAITLSDCARSKSQTAMTSVPHMPTTAQMMSLFQPFAPEQRANQRRYRARLIAALSAPHRAAIAEAIGQYTVADKQNRTVLVERIDRTLSVDERKKIMEASSAYMTDQDQMGAKFVAAFARGYPELFNSANARPAQTPITGSRYPFQAGVELANWLPALDSEPDTTGAAKPSALSALTYGIGNSSNSYYMRMRTAMLTSLTTDHRAEIGLVLGQSTVSNAPASATLSERVDDLLTAAEGREISAAFESFLTEQRAEVARYRKEVPNALDFEVPDFMNAEQDHQTRDPGTLLWRVLLGDGPPTIRILTLSHAKSK